MFNLYSMTIEYVKQLGEIKQIILPKIDNNITGLTDESIFLPSNGEKIQFIEDVFDDVIELEMKNSYNGKIFNDVSNRITGDTNTLIKIRGLNLTVMVISFDTVANQYASEIEVNGTLIANNSVNFVINATNSPVIDVEIDGEMLKLQEVTLLIKKWNKPNQPIRITSIVTGLSIRYGARSLTELNIFNYLTSNTAEPYYGININKAKVVMKDENGELKKLYINKTLKEGLKITCEINDNLAATFISTNVKYDNSNSNVIIDLQSSILDLQLINFNGYVLPDFVGTEQSKTAWDMINEIYPYKWEETCSVGIKEYLTKVIARIPLLKADTVYNCIFALMGMCQTQIIQNKNDEYEVVKYV